MFKDDESIYNVGHKCCKGEEHKWKSKNRSGISVGINWDGEVHGVGEKLDTHDSIKQNELTW